MLAIFAVAFFALCSSAQYSDEPPIASPILNFELIGEESQLEKLYTEERFEEFRQLKDQEKLRLLRRIAGNRKSVRPSYPHHGPVEDYSDSTYVFRANIGTPPQEFRLVPDTTASATWVVDQICSPTRPNDCPDYCNSDDWCELVCEPACCPGFQHQSVDQCNEKKKFDSTKSRTHTTHCVKWSGAHGRLGASGFIGNDTFRFGSGDTAVVVEGVAFAQATHIPEELAGQPIDGVLGLAFGVTDKIPPFHAQMFQQHPRMSRAAGLYYKKLGGRPNGQKAGFLSLGGIDEQFCRNTVVSQYNIGHGAWVIKGDKWGVGGNEVEQEMNMLLDSTTPYIYGSQKMLDALVKKTNARRDPRTGLYVVDCRADASFYIDGSGEDIKITSSSLIWQLGPRTCALAFEVVHEHSEHDLVLGAPLFYSYCVYFDYKQQEVRLLARE